MGLDSVLLSRYMKHKIFHITLVLSWTFKMKVSFPITFIVYFLSKHPCSVLQCFTAPCTLSTKENLLHSVCVNTSFVLRVRLTLGCGAVRSGTTRGRALRWTQVVHQWEAVLPTEVHKFNLSDTAVKVDS